MTITANERQDNVYAIAAVLTGAAVFSFGDAVVKWISISLVLWQILTLRAIIAIPALIAICRLRSKPIPLLPQRKNWTLARSVLMISMWLTYYAALIHLSISVAATVYYTMPIFLTLIAAILIGERVSISSWFAVLLGFLGVLITIKPNKEGFDIFTLLPLCSALFFAFAMIITRVKLQSEHPYILTINLQICFLLAGLVGTGIVAIYPWHGTTDQFAFFTSSWRSLNTIECVVIFILAVAITVGNILTSIAYQKGKASVIGTLSFAYIPFIAIWGFIFLGEVPEISTFLGMIMISIAGFIVVRS